MKRLIMMLLLVALAIPATAFAAPFGSSGHGTCAFTTNDKTKTMSLVADCTTDTTIGVPDGYTLDGKGFTITAVDGPTGASFEGAVVQNDGTAMNVKNLKIEGGVPNNCVAVFNGVAFMNASGSIKNVTLNNIGQTTGCQSGRAILVGTPTRRRPGSPSRSRATPSGTTTRTGSTCAATSTRRSSGTPSRARADRLHRPERHRRLRDQHGRAGRGQQGQRERLHGPADTDATGILVIDAKVSIDRKNTLSGNEIDIDNEGWHHRRQVQRLTTRAAGVATPTPDSPARQLMHREARSGGPLSFRRAPCKRVPGCGAITDEYTAIYTAFPL